MSSPQKKIRVALIGLNAPFAGTPTGTNWAAAAHLPYLQSSDKYKLVALQNSSVNRAKEAIKAYGLDEREVKAYGTPEDVAKDPDVDLVVSCIRVDRHAGSLNPSIKAGKKVFVEWPVEANSTIVKELTDMVKTYGNKNVVGLQSRFDPLVQKIKAIISRGGIGKLESSTIVAHAWGGASMPSHVDYFVDRDVGGNHFVIMFSHFMECLLEVLGDVESHSSLLVNQYPTVSITDPLTNEVIDDSRPNNVPNQRTLNAIMKSGAVLTYKFHGVPVLSPTAKPRSPGRSKTPALEWRIYGSKGEIRVTSYDRFFNTWSLNAGPDELKVEIYDADEDCLTELENIVEDDGFKHLPPQARNIARLYEAFAAADSDGTVWYPDFEYALTRHQFIDILYAENK